VSGLAKVLGGAKVLGTRDDLLTYEYDGSADTASPRANSASDSASRRSSSRVSGVNGWGADRSRSRSGSGSNSYG